MTAAKSAILVVNAGSAAQDPSAGSGFQLGGGGGRSACVVVAVPGRRLGERRAPDRASSTLSTGLFIEPGAASRSCRMLAAATTRAFSARPARAPAGRRAAGPPRARHGARVVARRWPRRRWQAPRFFWRHGDDARAGALDAAPPPRTRARRRPSPACAERRGEPPGGRRPGPRASPRRLRGRVSAWTTFRPPPRRRAGARLVVAATARGFDAGAGRRVRACPRTRVVPSRTW